MSISLTLPETLSLDVLDPDAIDAPTVSLAVRSLRFGDSPRGGGLNDDHCRMLAATADALPPVVVHSRTMRVVDGNHRVRAAVLSGRQEIAARMFEGSADEAFVLAIRLNTVHGRGLLLTRADRTAAAGRLITTHPHWSNRMIASLTGLSAGTIGRIRDQEAAADDSAGVRVERLLRYAVEGIPRPNYDAVASQLLFNYLEGNGGIGFKDGRIGLTPRLPQVLRDFLSEIESIESGIHRDSVDTVKQRLLDFTNKYTDYDAVSRDYRHIPYFAEVKSRLGV